MDFLANTGTCQEINGSTLLPGVGCGVGTVVAVMDVALCLHLCASIQGNLCLFCYTCTKC